MENICGFLEICYQLTSQEDTMMKKILFYSVFWYVLRECRLRPLRIIRLRSRRMETTISDNWKTMLKNSIALDTINAENNTHLLEWQDVKNPSDEAVKLVDKIQKLQAEQEEDQESMDPLHKGEEIL